MTITPNDDALASVSAVLEISATNPEYNQPALSIKKASCLEGLFVSDTRECRPFGRYRTIGRIR
jgi:hypothetical protein